MASSSPKLYRHGSHPEHHFGELRAAPTGRQCSVCRAESNGSEVRWFACAVPGCDFLLCAKCFSVEEQLLPQPQVVIRNPLLSYDDPTAAVQTRPRHNGYRLSPMYPGRLMRVVSTAVDDQDASCEYYRIATGGWIRRSQVLCVSPHASAHMELLAELHFSHRMLGKEIASGAVDVAVLTTLLSECMDTIDSVEDYGIVMSALVMFPLLSTLQIAPSAFRAVPDPAPFVQYVHFVLHFALAKLEERMDEEERQYAFKLVDGTMAPLFGDVLARCLCAAYHLACTWRVRLQPSFVHVVARALAAADRLRRLIPEEASEQPAELCAPSLGILHARLSEERKRLSRLLHTVTDLGGCCLQQCIRDTRFELALLQPIRNQLCGAPRPHLSRVFCEALATMAELDLLRVQQTYLQLDALEILGGLAANACAADAQIAVYRLTQHLAKQCPHNIAMLSAVLLDKLIHTLATVQSPAAYVEAVNCFFEMAFNDPRMRGAEAAEKPQPQSRACTAHAATAAAASDDASAGRANTPYQLMYVYSLHHGGALVPLCAHCAAHHPPMAADLPETAQYAYFRCQCHHCAAKGPRGALRGSSSLPQPLPSIPLTAALRMMEDKLPDKLLAIADFMQDPASLNALGRLLLRLPSQESVLVCVTEKLARYPSLEAVPYAALVVKANAHLPSVQQRLAECGGTELARYVCHVTEAATPAKYYVDETPSKSNQRSELGLSASPYASSAVQSGSLYEMRGGFSGSRGVQLFDPVASLEDETPQTTLVRGGGARDGGL